MKNLSIIAILFTDQIDRLSQGEFNDSIWGLHAGIVL